MPQKLAGWRIDPPVSVPVAAIAIRAATAAAEPPDEPPGTRVARSLHGLTTGPNALVMLDEPMANSSRFALPRNVAPAASSLPVTVLS